MDTKYTPTHSHLWNHEFWMINFAGMLLTASAFMPLSFWAGIMPVGTASWGYAAFVLGLPVFGPAVSFLIDRYRRNVVCVRAVAAFVIIQALFLSTSRLPLSAQLTFLLVLRFLSGAFYGLAQMVLVSTLVTECCESDRRTDANYALAWFERLALSIGPFAGLLVFTLFGINESVMAICGAGLLALLLILMVRFPFRAPEDTSFHLTTDRFLLLHGMPLLAHVLATGFALGVLMLRGMSVSFFSMMMVGFLAALVLQKCRSGLDSGFLNPEWGMLLLLVALLLSSLGGYMLPHYVAPLLGGMAVGLVVARLQLYLVGVSLHCQRGTSQSSFWLAWEMGMAIAFAFFYREEGVGWDVAVRMLWVAHAVTLLSLAVYMLYTRKWYRAHIKRETLD